MAPILALRTATTFLLGRAFIETLHARGLPAALRAPRAFGRAVALRRACSGAAVRSHLRACWALPLALALPLTLLLTLTLPLLLTLIVTSRRWLGARRVGSSRS